MVANKLNETTELLGALNIITASTQTHLLTILSLQANFSYKVFKL